MEHLPGPHHAKAKGSYSARTTPSAKPKRRS